MTTNKQAVLDFLIHYPAARKEIEAIDGITGMYYAPANGFTPSIFVLYDREGDRFLERVRLDEDAKEICFGVPGLWKGIKA